MKIIIIEKLLFSYIYLKKKFFYRYFVFLRSWLIRITLWRHRGTWIANMGDLTNNFVNIIDYQWKKHKNSEREEKEKEKEEEEVMMDGKGLILWSQ